MLIKLDFWVKVVSLTSGLWVVEVWVKPFLQKLWHLLNVPLLNIFHKLLQVSLREWEKKRGREICEASWIMQKKDKSKNRRVSPCERNRDGIKLHSPLQKILNFSFLETYRQSLNKYIIKSVDATFWLWIHCLISYNIKFLNALYNISTRQRLQKREIKEKIKLLVSFTQKSPYKLHCIFSWLVTQTIIM